MVGEIDRGEGGRKDPEKVLKKILFIPPTLHPTCFSNKLLPPPSTHTHTHTHFFFGPFFQQLWRNNREGGGRVRKQRERGSDPKYFPFILLSPILSLLASPPPPPPVVSPKLLKKGFEEKVGVGVG